MLGKLQTENGRIGFGAVKFDNKTNVGAVLMEHDGLGVNIVHKFGIRIFWKL